MSRGRTSTEREVNPLADHDVHGRVDALGSVLRAFEVLVHARTVGHHL